MAQAGKRDPKDPYDARNPGVRPYRGSTDSELEEEEQERRRNANTPPDYGGPGMPPEPGMIEPTHGRSPARVKLNELTQKYQGTEPFESERPHMERAVGRSEGAGAVGGGRAGRPATGQTIGAGVVQGQPRWRQHLKKRGYK